MKIEVRSKSSVKKNGDNLWKVPTIPPTKNIKKTLLKNSNAKGVTFGQKRVFFFEKNAKV